MRRNPIAMASGIMPEATAAKLAALAEQAGEGLRINLEFGLFTQVKSIAQASAVLRRIDHPAMALLIDALHWRRSGGTLADIAAVPPIWLSYVQLCDAPDPGADPDDPAAILAEAIGGRMAMGEGGLPLSALLDVLPLGIPIAIEERSRALRDAYPDLSARAARMLARTRQWIAAQA